MPVVDIKYLRTMLPSRIWFSILSTM